MGNNWTAVFRFATTAGTYSLPPRPVYLLTPSNPLTFN